MHEIFKGNLIQPMDWEVELAKTLGTSLDLTRFTLAFFCSVPLGAGIRLIKSPAARNLYAFVSGISLVYYTFGNGVLHAFPPAILTYLGMLVAPKSSGYIAWAVCFPYLIAIHVANASGGNWNKGKLDFTAAEMVLVLKLVSMGMCYQDDKRLKPEDMNSYQMEKRLQKPPGILEYLGYMFCMGNLLAGPYFELKDYQDWINHQGLWSPKAARRMPSPLLPGLKAFAGGVICLALHMLGDAYYPTDTLKETEFFQSSLLKRLWLMYIVTIVYRIKYYFVWGVSEAALVFAGLSYEGFDEKGNAKWSRCTNAKPIQTELGDSARKLPLGWNTCTGNFLRRYVYERSVPKGKKPTFWSMLLTQMVSAVWHGLYPGYVLFFASTAIFFQTSSVIYKWEQAFLKPIAHNPLWTVVKIVLTMESLAYLATSFFILEGKQVIMTWASVYFIPHIYFAVLYFLGQVIPARPRKPKAGEAKADGVKEE